jgi:RNA polymerase sigma-70 factor (ECF subfamily)
VLRALASLSPADREVLLLVTWDGLSHAQAAEVLSVRPATLTTRLYRARQRLKRSLEDPKPVSTPRPSTAAPMIHHRGTN